MERTIRTIKKLKGVLIFQGAEPEAAAFPLLFQDLIHHCAISVSDGILNSFVSN